MSIARKVARRTAVWALKGPLLSLLWWRARRRKFAPGISIITVNYNTLPYLQALVRGVRAYTTTPVRIVVVDNCSTDGSVEWARAQEGVEVIALRANVHHGPAMDIGILRCTTEFFIALDVDAFPISETWLDRLIEPLQAGAQVSGAGYPPTDDSDVQPYVHACCLAMRTARFVGERHTFCAVEPWDTAQRISVREWPHIHCLKITSSYGPGILGSVFGDVVYHNFYSARFAVTSRDKIDWVSRGQPEDAWEAAMRRYFPTDQR